MYPIHQAINRPLRFKGIEGPYLLMAAAGLIGDLLLFVILYCCHIPAIICIGIAVGAGAITVSTTSRLSRTYGAHGLLKKKARRRIPTSVRWKSRRLFTQLNLHYDPLS
jgi:C4-dicarboxylate transporter